MLNLGMSQLYRLEVEESLAAQAFQPFRCETTSSSYIVGT